MTQTLRKPNQASTKTLIKQAPASKNSAASHYSAQILKGDERPREIEARALLKAARFLQTLVDDIEPSFEKLEAATRFNREIWVLFFEQATTNLQTNVDDKIAQNMVTLARFVFAKSLEALTYQSPQKLRSLIAINRELAAGLLTVKQQHSLF